MFICNQNKFIYIDIPKTGSRSILHYLQNNFTGSTGKSHELTIPNRYTSFFSFTVVRNPYDRICSLWWSTCKRNHDMYGYIKTFERRNLDNSLLSFLKIHQTHWDNINFNEAHLTHVKHIIPQYKYVEINHFNKILKFENLNDEFKQLPFVNNNAELIHNNRTTNIPDKPEISRPQWQELVGKNEGTIINKMFDKEFELFDYKKVQFNE